MADDITLTVRVRDLSRGDLNQVRQRLRGMDNDMRRVSGSSGEMSERARVLSRDIHGVSGRLGQMNRTGSAARHEMTYMSRSMSLLSRELTHARQAGHLTGEEFNTLRNQLNGTRLDFDRLNRDLERHSAVALRRQRTQAAADRDEMRRRVAAARDTAAQLNRISRAQTAAIREEQRRQAAADRAAMQRRIAAARDTAAQINRISRSHTAALREEARRQAAADRADMQLRIAAARQTAGQLQRIARAHTAALREEARRQAAAQVAANRDEEREINRFRQSLGDVDLSRRFRAANVGDNHDLVRGFSQIRSQLSGISTNSDDAARHVRMFSRDMNAMSSILTRARNAGGISRRDFDSLSSGVDLATRNLRTMRHQGVINRATYRSLTGELTQLRAGLRTLGSDGNVFTRLASRTRVWGGHLRRATQDGNLIVRTLGRLGDWGARGAGRGSAALGLLSTMFGNAARRMARFSRAMWIILAVIALIGPAAAALGAILTTVLGGAFIALGAFALRGSAGVKAAFSDMKSTVGTVIRQSAAPLQDSLVAAMGQVAVSARKLQPILTQAFAATAPLVGDFVKAFTNFGSSAMPGMVAALNHSKAAMAGFAEGMSRIGKGFGDMFRVITQGNDAEIGRVWVTLGNEIGNTLRVIGQFIGDMTRSGAASMLLIGIFRTLNGILHVIATAFHILDLASLGFFKNLANHISGFKGLDPTLSASFDSSGKSLLQLQVDLAKTDKDIARIKKGASSIPGPAKKVYEKDAGLDALTAKRAGLLDAIKQKEQANADAVSNEARSYKDLVQAIQSLADLNRTYLDAQAAQAQAVADANKKIKEGKKNHEDFSHALKMTNGQLDLISSQTGRDAYGMLSQIASATKESTDKAIAAHAPWEQIRENWKSGYNNIVQLADGMGLTATQARALATQILGIPPTKEVEFKARTQGAIDGIDSVIAAFQAAPDQKKIAVDVLSDDAVVALETLGYKVETLPDGTFAVTAKTNDAKNNIKDLQAVRDALKSKSVTLAARDRGSAVVRAVLRLLGLLHDKDVTVTTHYRNELAKPGQSVHDAVGGATGGMFTGKKFRFAGGGQVQGPGTGTSDSVFAPWLSNGEFVIRASSVNKYGPGFLNAINRGEYQGRGYAKGGKVSKQAKAEHEAANSARGDLTISHFGKMAGYKNDEFKKALGLPEALGGLVDSLNHWRSVIMKGTHGGVEKHLLKQLDKAGKSLIKYEKSLSKTEKSLEKAKTKLDDLKQAAASLRDSVKSGVMSATDITRVAGNDKNVTMSDIMSGMKESVDKSSAFSDALKNLAARGVSSTVIDQIAEAGISGGGLETAGALMGASDSEIQSINDMQKKINANAKSAGKTAADAMYAAGIKAADGLVKGLTKKKKDIEKAMMDIAKSMEKAIKKALGIHSPSRVMQKVGHYTAEGFAVGMKKNRSVDTAWTSMLTTQPTSGGSSSAGSSSNGPMVIELYIGNNKFDEIILDSNRRTVRTRGGNVQAVFGRKNG